MSKKAISTTFVVVSILFLLLAFGMFFFIKTVFEKTQGMVPEKKCETTVAREATLNFALKLEGEGHTARSFASTVECQQIAIPMPGKDEALAGLTGIFMGKCWKIFGQGDLELFSKDEGTFCHICYILTYDQGTTFELESALQKKSLGSLQGKYDAPATVSAEKYAIVFRYRKDSAGIEQKLFVLPLDSVSTACHGAEFPRQRLA